MFKTVTFWLRYCELQRKNCCVTFRSTLDVWSLVMVIPVFQTAHRWDKRLQVRWKTQQGFWKKIGAKNSSNWTASRHSCQEWQIGCKCFSRWSPKVIQRGLLSAPNAGVCCQDHSSGLYWEGRPGCLQGHSCVAHSACCITETQSRAEKDKQRNEDFGDHDNGWIMWTAPRHGDEDRLRDNPPFISTSLCAEDLLVNLE